ncbi:MAG: hypothetical protein M0Q90_06040 [Bacteroidales bacterium]|nr:hypothetical protein [Bacteroidales bacterium]
MKIKSNILVGALILLCGFWSQLEAQTQTAVPLQPNQQEVLLNKNNNKESVWLPLSYMKGIYFNGGVVGIGTEKPSEKLLLHVAGTAGVNELVINDQYSLPTERGEKYEFLNGLGEWEIISSSVGGESFWEPVGLNNGIYYDIGRVGIGTATPGADLHVQGNMKLGSNIGNVGTNAFAGGDESVASGTNSFAFGDESKATNNGAFAVGLRAEASGTNSIAIGRASKANYENAFALGYVAEAIAINSIVIGRHARATESNAYIVGSGAGLSTKMLVNNIENSLIMGFNSNLPTFFVSSSEGVGTTGKIGIGNMTDPEVKLHILSDIGEAAVLKLEHRTTGTKRYAEIGLGTHRIRAGNTENMVFSTPATNRHFVFENGNVGIGVSSPSKKLEVAGDIEFSGDLYSNGQLFTGSNWTVNGENIYRSTGYVGIGTESPNSILHVHEDNESVFTLSNNHGSLVMAIANTPSPTSQAGDVVFKTTHDNNHHGIVFNMNDNFNDGNSYIKFNDNHNHNTLTVFNNGTVGINTSNTFGHQLAVNGSIITTEVLIRHPSNWYDHVFDDDYSLMKLDELEVFISKNRHLPDIPSEDKVKSEGVQMGEITGLLLKKIEELTLYTIEQQKLIEKQQNLLDQVMQKIQKADSL